LREGREWLASDLERAGWPESPERVTTFAIALATCLGLLGASAASAMPAGTAALVCVAGIVLGLGLPILALRSAIERRRRRLEGELVPLLELFTLELGGGGSPISALGSVTLQVQGELASDLRRLLIASQVSGSASFESRLVEYSEHIEIPAIGSLATILAAGREYGTGAVQGVRALATDLRRAQRRDLIAQSRRALNHVLLPAAIGVLLPFLAVLMFPAVTALQRNLR
jgi:pilus assembly protein TadC